MFIITVIWQESSGAGDDGRGCLVFGTFIHAQHSLSIFIGKGAAAAGELARVLLMHLYSTLAASAES